VFTLINRIFNIILFILGGYVLIQPRFVGAALGLVISLSLTGLEVWKNRYPQPGFKILDTSVIIDGRIADICKTGFLEGTLVIPGFVLQELQRIADSADVLKRNRGRRGLDTLAMLQRMPGLAVRIMHHDFPEIPAVDEKLLRLAKKLQGRLLTNDINLNKIASLQKITVLNINDLSNAVKTVVLPGEEMVIKVIKEGKEPGQGVGYLDDGTMVVIENGRGLLNQRVAVNVTSVLQTTAGRMVFAKTKGAGE
jgi:uncharacterized protein YacL